MKIFKKKEVTRKVITAIVCDRCGKSYKAEEEEYNEDILEIQEFLHIDFVGGYNSVFGDMNHVKADICQHCLKPLIESFARINSEDYRDNAVCVIE